MPEQQSGPSSRRAFLSVRGRVALYSGISGVIFATLLAVWVAHSQQGRVREAVEAAVRREAHVAGQFISVLVSERKSQIEQLASLPELSSGLADVGAVRLLIERVHSYHPEFEWVAMTDAKGVVLAATGARLERSDMSHASWFEQGKQAPWIGLPSGPGELAPYLPIDSDGRPTRLVDLSVPVIDYDGRTVGVLVARLNWRWVVEQQAAISKHDPALRDTLLLGPKGEVWLGPMAAIGGRLVPANGQPVPPGQAPTLVDWPDVGQRLSAAAPLALTLGGSQAAGMMVVRQDPKAVPGASEAMGWQVLSMGLAAAVAFMVITWWLASRLTRPLATLTEAATDLREGREASFLAASHQNDEFGVLARALGDMHHQLQVRMLELANYRDHLEDKIKQRTEQLSQALDKAEAANRTKGAFIANMSHEIRTPMNAILGATFLMRQGELPAAQLERLQMVDQAASHLLDIINDILDLSKLEAGMFVLHPQPTELAPLMQRGLDMVSSRAREKGLQLTLAVPEVPFRLMVDGTRLSQVIINLLSNAVKFSEQGEVKLVLHITHMPDGPGQNMGLRFEVQDQGVGIAPESVAQLFQPFVQVDESTTRRFGGTGLGLAITRSLVECMGGEVGVHSVLGQGSTFWFTLNLQAQDAPVQVKATGLVANLLPSHSAVGQVLPTSVGLAASTNLSAAAPLDLPTVLAAIKSRHGGRKVLVADDNPVNLMLTSELLDMAGLQSVEATTGQEAVDVLRSPQGQDIMLVLMDVHMPVMDGMQATRVIRADEQLRDMPVLAMTASVLQQEQEQCLQAGMNSHLSKPVDPLQLFTALLSWLNQRVPESA